MCVAHVCSASVFGEHNCIKPRDTRQYLYRISPSSWPMPKKGKDGKVRGWCSAHGRTGVWGVWGSVWGSVEGSVWGSVGGCGGKCGGSVGVHVCMQPLVVRPVFRCYSTVLFPWARSVLPGCLPMERRDGYRRLSLHYQCVISSACSLACGVCVMSACVIQCSQVDRTTTLLAKPSVLPGVVALEKPFKITCTLKNLRYSRCLSIKLHSLGACQDVD